MDQVKWVTTLHSGKVIEKLILEPCEKDDELISKGKEIVEPEHCKEKTDSRPVLSFLHVMTKLTRSKDWCLIPSAGVSK
jgi:hypothetical protein